MKEAAMEAPEMVTFDGETFQAAGPWLPAPEIAQYVRTEVMDALAARLAEVERELAAVREAERLTAALRGLTEHYVAMVNSGDCGFWNPEEEPEVIAARAALQQEGGE